MRKLAACRKPKTFEKQTKILQMHIKGDYEVEDQYLGHDWGVEGINCVKTILPTPQTVLEI